MTAKGLLQKQSIYNCSMLCIRAISSFISRGVRVEILDLRMENAVGLCYSSHEGCGLKCVSHDVLQRFWGHLLWKTKGEKEGPR